MAGFNTHAALLLSAILPALAVPTTNTANLKHGSVVPGNFIVKVKPELCDEDFESQVQWVSNVHKRSLSRRGTSGVRKTFKFNGFRAYSGEFDDSTLEMIKANETVLLVEPDVVVNPLDEIVTQDDAEYNLALISSDSGFENREPVNSYRYEDLAGEGQFVYVVDTGVFVEHEDFEGRALKGFNARPELPFTDGYGHGTHCAGTVGSKTYGVAKKSTIFDVKVLDENGAGTIENMLDGYTWAVQNATDEGRVGQSLVSMSLGWPRSQIINDAVEAAYQQGFLTVVSAGNDNRDASTKSPASAPNALTVGATDYARKRASYSNTGERVDIWGPGHEVLSLGVGQGRTIIRSGTSMSTPAVAGLVAYLRALAAEAGEPLDDADKAIARVKELAHEGVVEDVRDSPNLFAYNGLGTGNSTYFTKRLSAAKLHANL